MIDLSTTTRVFVSALALGLAMGTSSLASERVEHYAALSPKTLDEAVAYFAEYNDKLAAILAQETLEGADHETIHELTYTLENALARMREDMAELADTLEALHLASEDHAESPVREHATAYLATARTLVP